LCRKFVAIAKNMDRPNGQLAEKLGHGKLCSRRKRNVIVANAD
jgi:hypothetical protein